MTDNKTDYAAMMHKPAYENMRSLLRAQIVPTRSLKIITAQMASAQQQVAARHADAFWSGENSLPIDGVLFVGNSGNGKSFGLRYAAETMPPIVLPDGTTVDPSPLWVDTPTHGTAAMLAREILRRADGVEMREPKDQDAPAKVIAALRRHKFSLIALDEISRIINPQRHASRGLMVQSHLLWTMAIEALNLTSSPTPVIMSGLPHVLDSFTIQDRKEEAKKVRREAQRRMKVVRLPDLDLNNDGGMLAGAIVKYCEMAHVESMLRDDDYIVPRLIHASMQQAGSALEWIQKAVALASVRPRGKLNRMDFAHVYGDMTSAAIEANPFAVSGWDRIDVGRVAPRSFEEAMIKGGRAR